MSQTKVKKIAVFVDVQNIYYTTRDIFGKAFNYRQFWQHISKQGDIVLANAYAIDRNDERQQAFQSALTHIGFTLKLKPFIQRRDGSAKGDWDVGITMDIMRAAKDVDVVVLLSGDGDFAILMEGIKADYPVKVEVYGVAALTAKALMDTADAFHPIEGVHLLQ